MRSKQRIYRCFKASNELFNNLRFLKRTLGIGARYNELVAFYDSKIPSKNTLNKIFINNDPVYESTIISTWAALQRLCLDLKNEKLKDIEPGKDYFGVECEPSEAKTIISEDTEVQLSINVESKDNQVRFNLPGIQNRHFVDERGLREQIHTKIGPQGNLDSRCLALIGITGIGKSELAFHYALQYEQNYFATIWINSGTEEALLSDYVQLAQRLGISRSEVIAGVNEEVRFPRIPNAEAVREWLSNPTYGNYLLIFDNADDLKLLSKFLPYRPAGAVLITTQDAKSGSIAEPLSVPEMGVEEAIRFVIRRARLKKPLPSEDRQALRDLYEAFGGLPLVLDQMAACLDSTEISPVRYLQDYRDPDNRRELLEDRGRNNLRHEEPVYYTMHFALKRLEKVNSAGAELLRYCALLGYAPVPEAIFTADPSVFAPPFAEVVANSRGWKKAIGDVHRYSLFQVGQNAYEKWGPKQFRIHPLVQTILRDELEHESYAEIRAENVVKAMSALLPNIEDERIADYESLRSHIDACRKLVNVYKIVSEEVAHLFTEWAYYLSRRQEYEAARQDCDCALTIYRALNMTDAKQYINCLNVTAQIYRKGSPSDVEVAVEYGLESLQAIRKFYSNEQHAIGNTINNLANLYYQQGHYDIALQHYEEALKVYDRIFTNRDHRDVATTYGNMADVYLAQGHEVEAEEKCLEALRIVRVLNLGGIRLARHLTRLGKLYHQQNRDDEARPLLQEAFDLYNQTYKEAHPLTLQIRELLKALSGK